MEAEDVAQEAWLAFLTYLRRGRVREEEERNAWLALVGGNRLSNLKRGAAWRLQESLDDEDAEALVGREEDPAVAYERGLVRALVREVLAEACGRISGPSHRIVILRGIEERTYEEIAETLGLPVARVRDRHRRAILVLRALFIRRFGADPAGLRAANLDAHARDLDHEEVTP